MNLTTGTLIGHIADAFRTNPSDFPRNGASDYPRMLEGWIANLEATVLPLVTSSATAVDHGLLTMHDKEHVEKVLEVATSLVSQMEASLTAYEMLYLVVGIYLHDLGNSLGRAGHEAKIPEVLAASGAHLGLDNIELRTANLIAKSHGGKIAGSKDTLRTLSSAASVFSRTVRVRLVAAMLRLADELADDPARANKVLLATGRVPKGAEVYHQIAAHLHSQTPKAAEKTIELEYGFFDATLFCRKLGKDTGEVYLLEEIFERSVKCYREATYCSRFTRPLLDFDQIKVRLAIYDGNYGPVVEEIAYTLAEVGYHDETKDIYTLAPELNSFRGAGRLTPEVLASQLVSEGIVSR